MNQRKTVVLSFVLSFIGVLFLFSIVSQSSIPPPEATIFEKGVIGGVFIFLCCVGISFALRPNWMKTVFLKKDEGGKKNTNESKRCLQGHHPDCSVFDSHRVVSHKKTWCAGCLGLLLGCVLSIVLAILYVIVPFQPSLMISRLLFFFGLLIIMLIYLESVLVSRHAGIHVLFSGLLILGFLFVTISITQLSGEIFYGFYTLLLCVLWLDTRIHLSKWHHTRLCRICPHSCKFYAAAIIFGR